MVTYISCSIYYSCSGGSDDIEYNYNVDDLTYRWYQGELQSQCMKDIVCFFVFFLGYELQ